LKKGEAVKYNLSDIGISKKREMVYKAAGYKIRIIRFINLVVASAHDGFLRFLFLVRPIMKQYLTILRCKANGSGASERASRSWSFGMR
jgi:hypothetical protein